MAIDFELVELSPQPTAMVRTTTTIAELPAFFEKAYHAVMTYLAAEGVEPAGPPFGYFPSEPSGAFELAAGFPVPHRIEGTDEVVPGELPGGRAVVALHVGPFDALEATYEDLLAAVQTAGIELGPHMWEVYLTDPSTEPDATKWQTQIVWPVA